MKLLILAAALLLPTQSDTPPTSTSRETRDTLKQAFELMHEEQESEQRYTYTRHTRLVGVPPEGGTLRESKRTFDVTWINNHPYWRLTAINDKPLSRAEEKQQKELYEAALANHKDFGRSEQDEISHWLSIPDDSNPEDVLSPQYLVAPTITEKSDTDVVDVYKATLLPNAKPTTKCPWRYQFWVSQIDHQIKRIIIDSPDDHSVFCDDVRHEVRFASVNDLPKTMFYYSRVHTVAGGKFTYITENIYSNYRKFTTTVTLHPGKEIPSDNPPPPQ